MITARKNRRARRGMTLIEVVIVLALLAGLAGMTLSFVGDLDQESRAKRTRDRAETMRTAVLGDGGAAGRFLADMGRLPVLHHIGEGRTLSEFYECPHDEVLGGTQEMAVAADFFGETFTSGLPAGPVVMDCGWNGPYLITSGGELYDGFGNDWRIEIASDPGTWNAPGDLGAGDVGERILAVASWGRDGVPGDTTWADKDEEIYFTQPAADASLTVTLLMRGISASGEDRWTEVSNTGPWGYADWSLDTPYVVGDTVQHSSGKYLFRCCGANDTNGDNETKSGTTQPDWDADSDLGDRKNDNELTWILVSNRKNHADAVRVALFVPYVPTAPAAGHGKEIVALIARKGGSGAAFDVKPDESSDMVLSSPTWSGHTVTYSGLTPGRRKLLACAFHDSAGTPENAWASQLVDVELKPGGNVVTVYLTEELN
jgi:prepilin-type N-terminal cleavage/methylation domain-containing protein